MTNHNEKTQPTIKYSFVSLAPSIIINNKEALLLSKEEKRYVHFKTCPYCTSKVLRKRKTLCY